LAWPGWEPPVWRRPPANLIAGCETLGIEREGVVRWQAKVVKMPPLLINREGQLKEWANPQRGEHNDHRHLMHLVGAFDGQLFIF